MKTVGVLALQGSVAEHVAMLERLNDVRPLEVKTVEALNRADGIILPGGESTTIGKLLHDFGLFEPLKSRIADGLPVWGTCAGLILLAKKILDQDFVHLGTMDITVRRNAYGGQLDSFSAETVIDEISEQPLPIVFIRAPWIESVGNSVQVLSEYNGRIIAARQNKMLVTSFHPELTGNPAFHEYFAGLIR